MTRRHQLETTLRTLKLSGMLDTFEARLLQAQAGDLGHSSIQVTMDRYGHLFPSDAEVLTDRLDATRRRTVADIERVDGAAEVVELPMRDAATSFA